MSSGRIDAIASGGWIEGWAIDENHPLDPLRVVVADAKGAIIASGLANLFRDDLVDAGIGCGWSAFRIRARADASLEATELMLLDVAGKSVLHIARDLPLVAPPSPALDIDGLILSDPTTIASAAQLRGCARTLNEFARNSGVDGFVRAAFVYIQLGRCYAVVPLGFRYGQT